MPVRESSDYLTQTSRCREVLKYFDPQSWRLAGQPQSDTGPLVRHATESDEYDSALSVYTQLAICQLTAEFAAISLIDSQYKVMISNHPKQILSP